MENLDIIILSTILSTLFIVFGIVIFKEFKTASNQVQSVGEEKSPRANMIRFVGSLFDEESVSKKDRKIIYKAVQRTVADMESNGMYFSDTIKKELKKQREELNCEYSGLPSVKAYEIN